MKNIGACIETFFTEYNYADRIKKTSEIGLKYYEFWFHNKRFDGANLSDEMKDFDMIAELNHKYGLTTTNFVFNHPAGGVAGSLNNKADRNHILDNLEEVISLAKKIDCKALICGSGDKIPGQREQDGIETMIDTLKEIGTVCEKEGITILLEPFNSIVDHPDCFLDNPHTAIDVLKAVNNNHVKLLYDIYHMQIMSGNISDFVRKNIDHIGHFHIAGVPGRQEPKENELNYPFLINEINKLGYTGGFGLEYWPSIASDDSLKETINYLNS